MDGEPGPKETILPITGLVAELKLKAGCHDRTPYGSPAAAL